MRNCPNCGAPIDPYKCKCEYCGTYYYDLTNINLINGEPCYIQFKIDNMILTTLAIPQLGTIEISSDTDTICDGRGTTLQFYQNRNCDIGLNFRCVAQNNNSLIEIKRK